MNPTLFPVKGEYYRDAGRFVDFVKTSETISPDTEILMPGDVKRRNREECTTNGIELDDSTWSQIETIAE